MQKHAFTYGDMLMCFPKKNLRSIYLKTKKNKNLQDKKIERRAKEQ